MYIELQKFKLIRHFNHRGHAHLLTFTCYHRMSLLNRDLWCRNLSRSITRATLRHLYRLIAFVYMPEHVHLLVHGAGENSPIEDLLYAIKKPFSDQTKRIMMTLERSPLLDQLTVSERPGKQAFRFWQEGPGHDRNILSIRNCIAAADYLHHNPVRRGLCESPDQWRWSSWSFYHRPEQAADPLLPRIDGFPA
jgi:putative transposase